jgi:2,5-diamino-6-(ribosylamino)-4(3H)-pyrimidinone 5'-phosphate reductase
MPGRRQRMKVIVHNSISLDGSLLGFAVDMAVHYKIAGSFKADIHLVGSNTAAEGLKMFYKKLPREREIDLAKPKANKKLPLWVIPDTAGKLQGKLHVLRRSGFCRDVAILAANTTPKGYLRYLTERNYDWHYTGKRPLDYSLALALLAKEYKAKTVMTDAGMTLNGFLLNSGLVDEVSLLVHPVIVGVKRFDLFEGVKAGVTLKLQKSKPVNDKVWLFFKVVSSRVK